MENKTITNIADFYKEYFPKQASNASGENYTDLESYMNKVLERYDCEVKKIIKD